MAVEAATNVESGHRPRGRPRRKGRIIAVTFRIPADLRDRLVLLAEKEDRTLTSVVCRALDSFLPKWAPPVGSEGLANADQPSTLA